MIGQPSEVPVALIVAVTCDANSLIRDFVTELLRVNFGGAKLATKGSGSICMALVTLPACRRRPFSSMNPTTIFSQKRNSATSKLKIFRLFHPAPARARPSRHTA
jgi:hypothetical protein